MAKEIEARLAKYTQVEEKGARWRPFSWNPLQARPSIVVGNGYALYTYPKYKLTQYVAGDEIAEVVRKKKAWYFFKGSVTVVTHIANIHRRESDLKESKTAKHKASKEFYKAISGYSSSKQRDLSWVQAQEDEKGKVKGFLVDSFGLAGIYHSKKLVKALEGLKK